MSFSSSEFLVDHNTNYLTPSEESHLSMYTETPSKFNDDNDSCVDSTAVMNPFEFNSTGKESTAHSLPNDLYMNFWNEYVLAAASCQGAPTTPSVSDPLRGSHDPLSPVYYDNMMFSEAAQPISLPNATFPSAHLKESTHHNPLYSTSEIPSPKSTSRTRTLAVTNLSPRQTNGRRTSPSLSSETTANGLKVFTCDYQKCGKSFKRLEHLKRHVRSLHTLEKPFQCPDLSCAKLFARADNLLQHIRSHKQMNPKQRLQRQQQNEATHTSFLQTYNTHSNGTVV